MNCGLMLTRLAYFAIGMLDDLPEAHKIEDWIAKCQLATPRAVKDPQEGEGPSRSTRSQGQVEEEEKEEEIKSVDSESSADSEETESEQGEDPFEEHPAQTEQWEKWEKIRQTEKRTK